VKVFFTAVLWNRNDLLWFLFRLWKSFGSDSGSGSGSASSSGSGSRQYLAVFQQQKFVQNLAFLMSEAVLFPRKLASFLIV
jgi:hypothetical protein